MVFNGEKAPYLSDVSNLLYDFELSYDLSVVLTASEYADYKLSNNFFYRNRRKLKDEYKIRVSKITKESPLIIVLFVGGAAALTVVLKALDVLMDVLEKASTIGLKREKLTQEVENLKKDNKLKDLEIEKQVRERQASLIRNSLARRLQKNPIQIVELKIQVIDDSTNEVIKTELWRSKIDKEKKSS